MKETKVIRTLEMVRRIRDEQVQQMAGKSDAEVIAFFRQAGQSALQAAQERLSRSGSSQSE